MIRRFIDSDAEFAYLPWGAAGEVPEEAVAFGIPGVGIGAHDESGTAFEKTLRQYDLSDPALHRMGRMIAAGVRHALRHPAPADQTADESALGLALDRLGFGMGVLHDDAANLNVSMALYDALYVYCRFAELPDDVSAAIPGTPAERATWLRERLLPSGRRVPARRAINPDVGGVRFVAFI